MARYLVQETSMTAVADKIREKTGITTPLEFPYGWIAALDTLGSVEVWAELVDGVLTIYQAHEATQDGNKLGVT